MQVFGPQRLNKKINLRAVKECVDVLQLTESDTLRIHPRNFDDLVEEYRDTYGHAMPDPFYMVGVLVEEAHVQDQPYDHIVAFLDDDRASRPVYNATPPSLADDDRPIYRCGYCGGIVDESGREVDTNTRALHIKILTARGHTDVQHRHGYCCRNEW
jgi:hypothetical protein